MAIRRTLASPSARFTTRVAGLALAAVLAALALVACGADTDDPRDADAISVADQWVKTADSGMTAAFGTLHNSSDRDIRVVSAHTDAARTTEMHEVVDNGSGGTRMQQKDGGFLIPADGTVDLTPGDEHFMLMELTGPIRTGQQITVTLRFADGSTQDFIALARDFDGNQENYQPGHEESGADDHDDHAEHP